MNNKRKMKKKKKLPHDPQGLSEAFWEEPYLVLLSTPTGIKVAGLDSWIHTSQVKHWTLDPGEPTPKPHPPPPDYSCEPVEDLKYLFKRNTSETYVLFLPFCGLFIFLSPLS
jgi:hypothetical protein